MSRSNGPATARQVAAAWSLLQRAGFERRNDPAVMAWLEGMSNYAISQLITHLQGLVRAQGSA